MTRIRLRPVAATHLPEIVIGRGESKTVGRSPTADVVIDEPSLSRLHARVSVDAVGAIAVEDLGSMNGLFINGAPLRSAAPAPGDTVRFGAIDYLIVPAASAAADPQLSQTVMRLAVAQTATVSDREALEALLATSRELMAFTDLPALLDRVLDRLHSIVKPDRAAILLVDPATGELKARAVRPAGAYGSVSEFASSTVVRDVVARREAVLVYDAQLDANLQDQQSVMRVGVRSVICVPLLGRAGAIGALYADQLGLAARFTPELVQYAAAFAAHAATALETAQLYEDRERHFRATLEAFARALDARDHYTAGHSERVTAYTLVLSEVVGMADPERETIRRSCMLHDIGKVGVPDSVLLKAGPLDPAERTLMQAHVTIGHEMLRPLPFFEAALPGVRSHHERWDGGGYPDRLAGASIHPHARLMAVADSYDAMTSARPYRKALPIEEATRRLHADRGQQFDPAAVDAFDKVADQFRDICERSHGSVG